MDCPSATKRGCIPRSSTIKPNSAATTSSRARINTFGKNHRPAKGFWGSCQVGNLRTRPPSASRAPLVLLGTNVHRPGKTLVAGDNTHCPYAGELTLGKFDKGVTVGADGAVEKTRPRSARAAFASHPIGARSPRKKHWSGATTGSFQTALELTRRVSAATHRRSTRANSPGSGDSLHQGVLRRVEQTGYFADVRGTSLA